MTGHAEGQGEGGFIHSANEQIRAHCRTNDRILYDFADIENYDPDGTYYYDRPMWDNLDYNTYRTNNWGEEWINANPSSEPARLTTGDGVSGYYGCSGCAHSDSPSEANLNCVLKGRACWWLWARLAGWDGTSTTPPPTPVQPVPTPSVSPASVSVFDSGDFNGDGAADIAIYRPSSGLWSVRGITRVYFGSSADCPVPADYDGDGSADIALFRPASGLWALRGISRVYFGTSADIPVPADYSGDGSADIGIFRSSSRLWAIRKVTRIYFGDSGDRPVPGRYLVGSDQKYIAVFRPSSGLWALRGLTRYYFGAAGDLPVPGDYDGWGFWHIAVFRPASGLWAIRTGGVPRRDYFGASGDIPLPANYNGDSSAIDELGLFRPSSGLWAVRGLSRCYYGGGDDIPLSR